MSKTVTNIRKSKHRKRRRHRDIWYDAVQDIQEIDIEDKIKFIKSSFSVTFKAHLLSKFLEANLWTLFIGSFCSALFVSYDWHILALISFGALICTYWQQSKSDKTAAIDYCAQRLNKDPERIKVFLETLTSPKNTTTGRIVDSPCEWVNDIFSKFWPNINSIAQSTIDSQGFQHKGLVVGGHTIYFERFTLGDKPPAITGIRVRKSGHRKDEIVIIVKLIYVGNCLVLFSYKTALGFKAKVGVKDVYFRGTAVLVLRPLLEEPPFVGGLSVCLQEMPLIDYNGLNLANIADNSLFKKFLQNIIWQFLVSPNKIFIPLIPNNPNILRELKYPLPIGLCNIEIIEAEDLPGMDTTRCLIFNGSSDTFCKVTVGMFEFETTTAYSSLSPYYGESFASPVHDFNDQLKIELFDKDAISKDDLMGSVEFRLQDIGRNKNLNGRDKWLPIGRCPTGSIHFRCSVFELSSNKRNVPKITAAVKQCSSHFPVGVLSVYVYYVSHISTSDEEFDFKPVVKMKFSDQKFQTKSSKQPIKGHYYFEESTDFLCNDFEKDVLEVSVVCLDMKSMAFVKVFGECNVAIKDIILSTRNMTLNKEFPIRRILKLKDVTEVKNTGILRMFLCLRVCKYRHRVIDNLRVPSNIQANIEETTENKNSLTKLYREPIQAIRNPFQSIRVIARRLQSFATAGKSVVTEDITKTLPQNDENCWLKLRIKWTDRKALNVEVLKLVRLPLDVVDRNYKYSICVRFSIRRPALAGTSYIPRLPNVFKKTKKVTETENNGEVSDESAKKPKYRLQKLQSKYTKKHPIINYSTDITYNERLIFRISPIESIDDYVLEVFVIICRPRKYLAAVYDHSFAAYSVPQSIPKVDFKGDPIEQWNRLTLFDKFQKSVVK